MMGFNLQVVPFQSTRVLNEFECDGVMADDGLLDGSPHQFWTPIESMRDVIILGILN